LNFDEKFDIVSSTVLLKYRRAGVVIDRYIQRMIDQEPAEIRAEFKRTSLISSLVSSLQQDEKIHATKSEEDEKGIFYCLIIYYL
jgi:uncharacterized protein YbcI